jgi:hypothetical protein
MDHDFFGPAPALRSSEDVLGAYRSFLLARNGAGFAAREANLRAHFDAARAPALLTIDDARFNRNYERLRERDVPPEELALLAFVKINAGEAWGVEAVSRARARQPERPGVAAELERLITGEEHFHTRLLVGAAGHFANPDGARLAVTGAWRPSLPLRGLIGALVHAPAFAFHPVLLGAEVAGVFMFNWLLERVRTLFPRAPQVRESMEARLHEVLVDEVGHITFNRVLVGRLGRAVGRALARQIAWAQRLAAPELRALGFGSDVLGRMSSFGLGDLPAEVRRRAFFA